jgi:hypothetical protein
MSDTKTDNPVASAKPRWTNAHFIVAVVLLGVSAISLNAATKMLQLHFRKVPIEMRHELDDPSGGLAARIGPWQMVSIDAPLPEDTEVMLGTKEYVFRDYVDTRKIPQSELDKFSDKTPRERHELLAALQRKNPDAVINIAVTYYTGMVDTIPHVPEICYVADGYVPTEPPATYEWAVPSPLLAAGEQLPVRFISFDDQTPTQRVRRNVAYFFQTQGVYEADPRQVRFHLQALTQRANYFAKIELMNLVKDHDQSVAMMKDFLNVALPEVERCLPDYRHLSATTQPADEQASN